MNKKGFEFSFGWLFAIIVGAMIIALAMYATVNLVDTGRKVEDSSKSVEFSSLLRQLETGLEQQGTAKISSPVEIKINNDCTTQGNTLSEKTFGSQIIQTSVSSGIGKEWSDSGVPLKSQSIYLFSNKTIQGKEFTTLTRKLDYPYKVADLVMIWPETTKFCFIDSPENVKQDIENANIGVNFSNSKTTCPKSYLKVCFAQSGCDIDVSQSSNSLTKNTKVSYYDSVGSALFYAALFSDNEIYECQVQRLAKKTALLGEIYSEKSSYGAALGCSAESLQTTIDMFVIQLNSVKSSKEFVNTQQLKQELEENNDALVCKIF